MLMKCGLVIKTTRARIPYQKDLKEKLPKDSNNVILGHDGEHYETGPSRVWEDLFTPVVEHRGEVDKIDCSQRGSR